MNDNNDIKPENVKMERQPNKTVTVPKDAQVIMQIMKDMGITEYEPRVINQLLEFIYRYVTSVLDDAKVYANHAKKKAIDLEDVRLAVQMQLDKSFTTPPPREVLLELARNKNVNQLPHIKSHCGLRLPPDRYCLSGCNYRLKPATKKPVTKTVMANLNKPLNSPKPTGIQLQQGIKRPASMMPKPAPSPKPVLKFTANSKVKPAIRVTTGPAHVKKEPDDNAMEH